MGEVYGFSANEEEGLNREEAEELLAWLKNPSGRHFIDWLESQVEFSTQNALDLTYDPADHPDYHRKKIDEHKGQYTAYDNVANYSFNLVDALNEAYPSEK